jgi:hypothetical protein
LHPHGAPAPAGRILARLQLISWSWLGIGRLKNGVASLAHVPAIHAFAG